MDQGMKYRFWEIDLLRGIAVVGMILFHLAFDLSYFGTFDLEIRSGLWLDLARSTASLFILLVGVSLSLAATRARMLYPKEKLYLRLVRRGVGIFALGIVVTAVTYILFNEGFIIFGVLHFIGIAVVLAYPFLRLGILNLPAGIAAIITGLWIQGMTIKSPWLLWLGLAPEGFYTLDYFPLIPWFGLVLLGIFIGDMLYGGYSRIVQVPDWEARRSVSMFTFMGRNSLPIYVVHQPVLILILCILGMIDVNMPGIA